MNIIKTLLLSLVSLLVLSCATKYVTPGGDVNISSLADEDISKILSNKPSIEFPANIAVARIQATNYSNYKYKGSQQQTGSFSMILHRNTDEENALDKLSNLQGIKQISPFNKLLLPYNYNSIKDLRLAAAKMRAQVLMIYTFDTEFIIDTKNYGPQNAFALGYLKNKEVKVRTTVSAAMFDVQTEYLYGVAEVTSEKTRKSNAWKQTDEVDNLRIETEKDSFNKLISEIEKMWEGIYIEYNK